MMRATRVGRGAGRRYFTHSKAEDGERLRHPENGEVGELQIVGEIRRET